MDRLTCKILTIFSLGKNNFINYGDIIEVFYS